MGPGQRIPMGSTNERGGWNPPSLDAKCHQAVTLWPTGTLRVQDGSLGFQHGSREHAKDNSPALSRVPISRDSPPAGASSTPLIITERLLSQLYRRPVQPVPLLLSSSFRNNPRDKSRKMLRMTIYINGNQSPAPSSAPRGSDPRWIRAPKGLGAVITKNPSFFSFPKEPGHLHLF